MSKQKYPQATSVSSDGSNVNKHVSKRKVGGYSSFQLHAKNDRKRKEAYARQDKYDGLTLKQRMESTNPNGSIRQRARIQKQMDLETVPAVKIAPMTEEKKAVKAIKRAKDAAKSAK